MRKQIMISGLIGLGVAIIGIPAFSQERRIEGSEGRRQGKQVTRVKNADGDIDKLYELVRQARADLEALRVRAGIPRAGKEVRREGRGEHDEGGREGRGEHAEGGREGRGEHDEVHREGRGEHAEGHREGRGEHAEGRREGRREHVDGGREGRSEHAGGRREGAGRAG